MLWTEHFKLSYINQINSAQYLYSHVRSCGSCHAPNDSEAEIFQLLFFVLARPFSRVSERGLLRARLKSERLFKFCSLEEPLVWMNRIQMSIILSFFFPLHLPSFWPIYQSDVVYRKTNTESPWPERWELKSPQTVQGDFSFRHPGLQLHRFRGMTLHLSLSLSALN